MESSECEFIYRFLGAKRVAATSAAAAGLKAQIVL